MNVLDKIESVSDIKSLNDDELSLLANEVRNLIIKSTSEHGGHLASSLGVVELTIALLCIYDFPNDKIVWDVGHQSYAYKILTDRKELFSGLRSFGGISGFPKTKESEFDSFDTGHSSTSISAGLGMCVARDLNKEKYKVVTVIGDGALTGGMAFEALNNVSDLKSNYIIILNDNEMSISKSSGGLNKALLGIRTSTKYNGIKKSLKKVLEKSKSGMIVKKFLIYLVNIFKQLVVSDGMFFENLNINYVGPVDGHNIKQMVKTIKTAMNIEEPVLIHIKTIKGKGYKPAEDNPTLFHGIAPFDIDTGEIKNKSNKKSYTKVFSEKLVDVSKGNDKIVAVTAAMADGTGLVDFSKKYPERFFDVGICEQHAVTFAAGMAIRGLIPIVCIYSSFLQRAFDQIIHDVCLQNLHVIFAIDRAGLVGADGETHQGIFDISYLKLIPNMTILAPKNDVELCEMIDFAINCMNTPVAIRYPRGIAYEGLHEFKQKIELGKSELLYEGKEIALFALGTMVSTALHIREKMKLKNKDVGIVNARFAKPIDYKMIDDLCKSGKYNQMIVIEENVANGGMGEDVVTYVNKKKYNINVKLISLPDAYIEHGDVSKLREMLKIDSDSIINNILDNT